MTRTISLDSRISKRSTTMTEPIREVKGNYLTYPSNVALLHLTLNNVNLLTVDGVNECI